MNPPTIGRGKYECGVFHFMGGEVAGEPSHKAVGRLQVISSHKVGGEFIDGHARTARGKVGGGPPLKWEGRLDVVSHIV